MRIDLDHSDLVMTLNEKQRDLRSACREWLNLSFSLDAMDMLIQNQANALIGEPTEILPATPGIIWISEIPTIYTDPIISEGSFTPRRSLMSRYARVGATIEYPSTITINLGGTA